MGNVLFSGSDLQASIMKIFDEKKKTLNPLLGDDLPFADESPERLPSNKISNNNNNNSNTTSSTISTTAYQNKENIPGSPKLYRNPSLHKSLFGNSKLAKLPTLEQLRIKESHNSDEEKERDSSMSQPDNERHIATNGDKTGAAPTCNNKSNASNKLKRSESLNKPDRTVSPYAHKLKRSESLNKPGDNRLKRSDSLTKNEKTESNLNRRRELSQAVRRTNKEFAKLKRKNGMPERSIKRRHTVGGTKDFDKINWLDNRYQEVIEEKQKERSSLRTSSPDLSSTRRERLFFEVNLVGPENVVVALRQHLIGARPQSLPEPRIFTVPLESHV